MELNGGTVDVSQRQKTVRRAVARSELTATASVIEAIKNDSLPKRGALATARAAGLLAAKKTSQLIPHCHPIAITNVKIAFELAEASVRLRCEVTAVDRTGPEMDALCGACAAALTLYDMVKGVCPTARIAATYVLEKEGGKSGHWRGGEQGE